MHGSINAKLPNLVAVGQQQNVHSKLSAKLIWTAYRRWAMSCWAD